MADSHYSYNGANILQRQGFRTPDKAQRDKNLFHCEFGTSEQQKQRCRLQCIPRTWQGSKQGHGGVFKDCYPQAMGDVSITRMNAPDSKRHICHTLQNSTSSLGPEGLHQAPGTEDAGGGEEVPAPLAAAGESPWKATRNILSDLWNAGQHHWLSLQRGTSSFTGVKCRAALWSFHFRLIFTVNFQFIRFDQIMVIIRLGDIHA